MKPITLLMILLSNQGYWQSGQENTIEMRWVTPAAAPQADLIWELSHGPASLGGGKLALRPAGESTHLTITTPEVRTRTSLRWTWRLVERGTGRELESGAGPVHLFPPAALASLPARMGQRSLIVIGAEGDLSRTLQQAKVQFTLLDAPNALQTRKADLVLVAADQLGQRPFDQSPLMNQARNGASIMIFSQSRPQRLVDYAVAERAMPQLAWRQAHPLLTDLDDADLRSLTSGVPSARFIQLPPDEAALEIAWRPLESSGRQPAPIDALLVSRSIGAGRIVLCQVPLASFEKDPRSQLLLRNTIEYLLRRPEPTPPPSQRRTQEPAAAPVPSIQIPSGD
jgi:hypothetical protein